MTYFNLQNAKIKAVAASVPDDVEYTTDYNDLLGKNMSGNLSSLPVFNGASHHTDWALLRQICVVPLLKNINGIKL